MYIRHKCIELGVFHVNRSYRIIMYIIIMGIFLWLCAKDHIKKQTWYGASDVTLTENNYESRDAVYKISIQSGRDNGK